MKIKSLVASLLLLPALLFAQGPITRNIVTTNTTPFVLSLMTNVSSTVTSNALTTATNISAIVAQDAAQAVVNQKLYQDVSLTIRGYGERAFDADKVVFNDGTIGHRPGTGYGNVYLRDFLMTREGLPERVTLTESWNILNTWSNTFYQAGWFVDSVDAAKQPNATVLIAWNAFTNNGSTIINPALDCAFDFTHAMFMDYRQRGNPLSFTNHWIVASNGMNFIGWSNSTLTAIPSVRITNDLVYLDKVALLNSPTFKWFGEFGFNDGIPKSGYSLWLSLLRFRALNESSEMAAAAGQQTTASNLAYQARSCSTNLITYLWTSTNWFLSCTITNDVADTIGSAFAVWIGAVDKPHALLIASNCVATSPGGVAFATNPSLTNGAPYFPGAGNPWKYSPISSPGTSQNQTAWPGFAGIWNYCCALWDGGVAAQNWYTLASTYATWNGAPIEYLAKPGSGNGTTFYMQGAQALSFFEHVPNDFQFRNFATNAASAAGFSGNPTQFTNDGIVTSIKSGAPFTNTPLYGSSTILGTLVLSGLAEDLIHTKPLFVSPAGSIVGWSQNGDSWTNLQYSGLSPAAQQIITNIAFSFAGGTTNLDLQNSTNLPYSGLSLTAQTAVTNAVISEITGPDMITREINFGAFIWGTNITESIYSVKAFGAKGDGVTINNGTIAAGSTTYTCTNAAFTSADVGKVISIYMAGTNYTVGGISYGLNLTATIQSTNSPTSVVLNRSALRGMTNRAALYGSDDTVAIQTAMDVTSTNGGGTIFFPRGIYIVNGPLQDTGTNTAHHNSQLYFPEIAKVGQELPTVTFEGVASAFSRGSDAIDPHDITSFGSTLWSTFERSPDPVNPARVIDCQNFNTFPARGGCNGEDVVSLNSLMVKAQHMNWRCVRDSDMWCLNLQGADNSSVEDVAVSTGFQHGNAEGAPTLTGTNAIGILTAGSFNENMSKVDDVMIRGFYTGLHSEENINCPKIFLGDCVYGIDLGISATPEKFGYVNCQESFCVFKANACSVSLRADNVATYNYTYFTNSCRILNDPLAVVQGNLYYQRFGTFPAAPWTNAPNAGLDWGYWSNDGTRALTHGSRIQVTNTVAASAFEVHASTSGAVYYYVDSDDPNTLTTKRWAHYWSPSAGWVLTHIATAKNNIVFDETDNGTFGVSGKTTTLAGTIQPATFKSGSWVVLSDDSNQRMFFANGGVTYLKGTDTGAGAVSIRNSADKDLLVVENNLVHAKTNFAADGVISGDGSGLTNLTGSGSATNALVGKTVFVDAINGNDATAVRGNLTQPALTFTGALAKAQSGDTIKFGPGTFRCLSDPIFITNKNLTILGDSRTGTILTSSNAPFGSPFYVSNVTLYVSSLCISNEDHTSNSYNFPVMLSDGADATFNDVSLYGESDGWYTFNTNISLTLINCKAETSYDVIRFGGYNSKLRIIGSDLVTTNRGLFPGPGSLLRTVYFEGANNTLEISGGSLRAINGGTNSTGLWYQSGTNASVLGTRIQVTGWNSDTNMLIRNESSGELFLYSPSVDASRVSGGFTGISPSMLTTTNSGTVGQVPTFIDSTHWYWGTPAGGGGILTYSGLGTNTTLKFDNATWGTNQSVNGLTVAGNIGNAILSGQHNTLDVSTATGNVIAGGELNEIGGNFNYFDYDNVISGGFNNNIAGVSYYDSIVGGASNTIVAGWGNIISGGTSNTVANSITNSWAGGFHALPAHNGSFVWSDYSSTADTTTTSSNQFVVRATGGINLMGGTITGNGAGLTNIPSSAISGLFQSALTANYTADKTNVVINAGLATMQSAQWNLDVTNHFQLSITNALGDGQILSLRCQQDATGNWLPYTTNTIAFGDDITGLSIQSAANSYSYLSFKFCSKSNLWHAVGDIRGKSTGSTGF